MRKGAGGGRGVVGVDADVFQYTIQYIQWAQKVYSACQKYIAKNSFLKFPLK
jgi:hypothetical protein